HGDSPRNMSSDTLLRNRISPIQMNRGSEVSAQLLEALQRVVPSSGPVGELVNAIIPIPPTIMSTPAIHTPLARNAISTSSRKSEAPISVIVRPRQGTA